MGTGNHNLLFSLALLVVGAASWAAAPEPPDPSSVDDEDQYAREMLEYGYDRMKRFAVAYLMVSELQARYDPRLRELDPESAEYSSLLAESDAEMVKAIESTGLTQSSYNSLAEAVATDRTLNRQVTDLIVRLKEDSPEGQPPDGTGSGEDVVDLGTMEVEGFRITKSLIDAEIEVALKRQISTDREDDYLLVCRDSSTGTRIKRRWCAYNGDLARAKRSDDILVVDPVEMQWRWERFYERLPD